MSDGTKLVDAMGTIFMSPRSALTKQCVMRGAPNVQVDDQVMPYKPEPEYENLCVAKRCMNWRERGALGFCDLAIPNEIRIVMLEEYLSR